MFFLTGATSDLIAPSEAEDPLCRDLVGGITVLCVSLEGHEVPGRKVYSPLSTSGGGVYPTLGHGGEIYRQMILVLTFEVHGNWVVNVFSDSMSMSTYPRHCRCVRKSAVAINTGNFRPFVEVTGSHPLTNLFHTLSVDTFSLSCTTTSRI